MIKQLTEQQKKIMKRNKMQFKGVYYHEKTKMKSINITISEEKEVFAEHGGLKVVEVKRKEAFEVPTQVFERIEDCILDYKGTKKIPVYAIQFEDGKVTGDKFTYEFVDGMFCISLDDKLLMFDPEDYKMNFNTVVGQIVISFTRLREVVLEEVQKFRKFVGIDKKAEEIKIKKEAYSIRKMIDMTGDVKPPYKTPRSKKRDFSIRQTRKQFKAMVKPPSEESVKIKRILPIDTKNVDVIMQQANIRMEILMKKLR